MFGERFEGTLKQGSGIFRASRPVSWVIFVRFLLLLLLLLLLLFETGFFFVALGYPGIHCVNQAGLKLIKICLPPLGLKVCTTTVWLCV